MNVKPKADLLYLIMGTNPFPNIVAAITRVKEDGEVICLCTKETKNQPYNRLKKLLKNRLKMKISICYEEIDTINSSKIEKVINNSLGSKIQHNNDMIIELNYTGGTKVMSSTAYNVFRNYNYYNYYNNYNNSQVNEIILSYIDPEKECLYYEHRKATSTKYQHNKVKLKELDSEYQLTVYDIISAYNNIDTINEEKIKKEPENEELSLSLGNLFVNIDEETYTNRKKFLEEILKIVKNYKSKNEIEEKIVDTFKSNNMPIEFNNFKEANFKDKKEGIKYFKKFIWLEDYVLKVLVELKEEGYIEDVIANVEKKINRDENSFEVDVVAYRKYKLYAISVTAIDTIEEAKGKLYEIKQRAKDLAGDEAGMCYINLCWNTEELENEYKNIWDDFNLKNTLIIGASKFDVLKEEIKKWIVGGGEDA